MAAIDDADVSIDTSGNIRWTGAAATNRHTVLEFIQWLMDKQDDGVAAGDDILDITVDTPFVRSTDQIVTLNSPFNIDDTFATHLYDGSVSQTEDGEETLYSGLRVIGPVVSGTEYMIMQAGKVLPAFWGSGINAEAAPSVVFSRHLVKSKVAGSEIDGQRITVLARELGDQFRRFPVTLGTANSVAAIANGADIFNENLDSTIAGWTSITNTEGFQLLDVDNDGTDEEYYSQWNIGTQTVNDTYERSKWITQRSHTADSTGGTPTGKNFIIDDNNTTSQGQAQAFIPSTAGGTEWLTEVRCNIKIGAGTPTGTIYCELWDSDDAASQLAEPTGGALARSEGVLASAIASNSVYQEVIFRFNRFNPSTGADQYASLAMANAQYFAVFRHDEGTSSAYFHVEGADTDQDSTMNQAIDLSGTWTADASDDINITVKSSPPIHGVPGEIFQGINVEVGYDAETGTGFGENDFAMWGTRITYDNLSGSFIEGEEIKFENAGTLVSGGQLLFDDGTDMIVALDSPAAAVIADGYNIVGIQSGATADINATIENEDKGGGYGIVLAHDDNSGSGEVYLQVLTGVNPVDNSRIYAEASPLTNYITATASITTRTISPEFLGTSTGSNIIGAYGIGFETADVGSSDLLRALDDATYTPPNNVAFTVSGLTSGEDRVLVGPRTGTSLDRGQWLLNTALTTLTESSVVVKTGTDTVPWTSPDDINWPNTGIGADNSRLRVERDDGIYQRIPYDSHDSTDTFTLGTPSMSSVQIDVVATAGTFTRASGNFLTEGWEQGARFTGSNFANGGNNAAFTVDTVTATVITVVDNTGMVDETGGGDELLTHNGWDFSDATDGTGPSGWDSSEAAVNNDVFLAFIDVLADAATESFTGVHTASNDRDLFVRVRDGGGTPIKTFESDSATFQSTAQTIAAVRTPDV